MIFIHEDRKTVIAYFSGPVAMQNEVSSAHCGLFEDGRADSLPTSDLFKLQQQFWLYILFDCLITVMSLFLR